MISKKKQIRIKEQIGKIITTIPGKSEEWLMLQLNDNQRMYFRGRDEYPIAFVDLKFLVRKQIHEQYHTLSSQITDIIHEELGISEEYIYICFHEVQHWGHGGNLL